MLERQPFHATELGGVVGDEPEPKTACVSGDEEIVGADHLATFLQVRTESQHSGRGVLGKLENVDVRKERVSRVLNPCLYRGFRAVLGVILACVRTSMRAHRRVVRISNPAR